MIEAYLRPDGRKGIRNVVAVAYLVECAHHVARRIVDQKRRSRRASDRLSRLLSQRLCAEDDEGARHASQCRRRAAGLAGLRELSTARSWRPRIAASRPAGRDPGDPGERRHARQTITKGLEAVARLQAESRRRPHARPWPSPSWWSPPSAAARTAPAASPPIRPSAAASTGWWTQGAACIFEETGELVGCEHIMAERARYARTRRASSRPASTRPRAITPSWASAASRPATPKAA